MSVDAGLPSAWAFNGALASFLATDAADAAALTALLTTGYAAGGHALRFEQLVQVLRERVDPELAVLESFTDTGPPGPLHSFLATALTRGARIVTTNFDSYIERAVLASAPAIPRLLQVFREEAAAEPDRRGCRSFERYVRRGQPPFAVLKLHGTLRDIHPGTHVDVRDSIGATLDRIGAKTTEPKLEPWKQAALAGALQGRVVCVLGYSGADDFDILPTLAPLLRNAAGMLWIRHDAGAPHVVRGKAARRLLPDVLRSAALGGPCAVVRGSTTAIVEALFGVRLPARAWTPARPADMLMSISPYANMSRAVRALLAARIAEEALDLPSARRRYSSAAAMARRSDLRTAAFAHFRLGHLARVRGDGTTALRELRKAERLYERLRDRSYRAQVLNSIGNVFLEEGDLIPAMRAYQRALRSARAARHVKLEATVLNNVGLIWKKRGQYGRAIVLYDQALALDREHRDKQGMARELGNKAAALLLLREYARALPVFAETLALARLLHRDDTVATALANRGIVYRHLRRYRDAQNAATEALEIERRLGRRGGIARCISLLAGIAMSKRQHDVAIRGYRRAIRIQQRLGAPEGLAADTEALGRALQQAGRVRTARNAFTRSAAMYRRLGNTVKVRELDEALVAITRPTTRARSS